MPGILALMISYYNDPNYTDSDLDLQDTSTPQKINSKDNTKRRINIPSLFQLSSFAVGKLLAAGNVSHYLASYQNVRIEVKGKLVDQGTLLEVRDQSIDDVNHFITHPLCPCKSMAKTSKDLVFIEEGDDFYEELPLHSKMWVLFEHLIHVCVRQVKISSLYPPLIESCIEYNAHFQVQCNSL